jgi:hypothetical protein
MPRTLTRCLAILALLAISTSARAQSADSQSSERGVPLAQGGVPLAQDGVPLAQDGVPLAQGGVPLAHDGVPLAQGGVPLAPPVQASPASSEPLPQRGVPRAQPVPASSASGAWQAQGSAAQTQNGVPPAEAVPGADGSTIFPSVSSKAKPLSAAWSQPSVKQPSPTRKTVFEQPDAASAQSAQRGSLLAQNGVPLASPSAAGVPLARPTAAGVPLARPVLGSSATGAQADESLPGDESCPQCGRPLDHPILGCCDHCGPVHRMLYMLSPSHIFGPHEPGSPVYHEPWINRPFSVGVFVGPIVGSPLINDWVGQQVGTLAGMRFGWDMDDDFGLELRLATANIQIYDEDPAYEAQLAQAAAAAAAAAQTTTTTSTQTTTPLSSAYLAGNRNADHFMADIDFLYYPWGDAHFRPYLLFGIGTDRIKFTDRLGTNYARILFGMPVGLGFKYHMNDWLIFRVECTDNIALAGGSVFQTQQNFSATGAFEVRLGRTRMQYWPWNPGR